MKNLKLKNPKNTLESQRKIERRAKRAYAVFACLALSMAVMIVPAFAADDPLQIVENLSDFIFSLIRAIGLILLGFGILPQEPRPFPAGQRYADHRRRHRDHLHP